ncbi:STAS domain-containing protein [Leptospira sp. GIMC2001]|uniref:STAS domain-containing protein n=1 Tax=Leptospira sp. GIMC2001 TaxID=1513297 RepID=UPI00234A4A14|nr:STAS domain-containing protein [Leptospira sp. GIMC2001]WCL47999.1 STAS domain-containing protein [Leptospira sp. GIMC2001]
MSFTVNKIKNHTVIRFEGALDIYSAPAIKKEIHKLVDDGIDSLVFDMINIKLLDSSGIALLANLQKRMKTEEGNFYLLNVNPDVLVILKLSSLDKFFTIFSSDKDLP